MEKRNIAVVGCGYWGKNLVRNFYELGALHTVCDNDSDALNRVVGDKRDVMKRTDFDAVLRDPEIDAVAIAAPAAQHYQMVHRSLLAGKQVYVEKPLALHVSEADQLAELADHLDRIIMVGHILEYHPAIRRLKQLIDAGELGSIKYIYSSRLNMGRLRTEEDILFSFAPHDVSAILYLLGEFPTGAATHGGTYVDHRVVDTTLTTCDFKSGAQAHIFVSWLHPFKEQKLTVVGGKKMAVFDDMEPVRKLVLYSHRIDWINRAPVAHKDDGEIVPLPDGEPLRNECQHFIECVGSGAKPRTDGHSGVRVLRVLDACERSLLDHGRPVELSQAPPQYFAHPTAVIDTPCEIGAGTHIWHFSHIMAGSKIGERCNLGQNVVVSPECILGNKVKIQNNVSVYTGVEMEDNVFCGPSMVFTNVVNPRSHIVRRHEYRKTLVKEGASIGANATIVCGVTLGRYSFVGAGAVVTRDVPDYALVVGSPARQIGFMCYCGIRLPQGNAPVCGTCGRQYRLNHGTLLEIEGGQSASCARSASAAATD